MDGTILRFADIKTQDDLRAQQADRNWNLTEAEFAGLAEKYKLPRPNGVIGDNAHNPLRATLRGLSTVSEERAVEIEQIVTSLVNSFNALSSHHNSYTLRSMARYVEAMTAMLGPEETTVVERVLQGLGIVNHQGLIDYVDRTVGNLIAQITAEIQTNNTDGKLALQLQKPELTAMAEALLNLVNNFNIALHLLNIGKYRRGEISEDGSNGITPLQTIFFYARVMHLLRDGVSTEIELAHGTLSTDALVQLDQDYEINVEMISRAYSRYLELRQTDPTLNGLSVLGATSNTDRQMNLAADQIAIDLYNAEQHLQRKDAFRIDNTNSIFTDSNLLSNYARTLFNIRLCLEDNGKFNLEESILLTKLFANYIKALLKNNSARLKYLNTNTGLGADATSTVSPFESLRGICAELEELGFPLIEIVDSLFAFWGVPLPTQPEDPAFMPQMLFRIEVLSRNSSLLALSTMEKIDGPTVGRVGNILNTALRRKRYEREYTIVES
jgi:hypothetical protein